MWLPDFRNLVGAAALAAFVASASADVKVGDKFPELAAAELAPLGGAGKLPDRGKVVLVDFWASWCAPCKASFPAMAKLHATYAASGLVIVAVSVDDNRAAAAAFWKKMNPPFTGLLDARKKLVSESGVPTMPTSFLIGRDGRVRFMHEGFHDGTERDLRKEIEALLAEKPTS